jgi:23S rRNA (adenine2503-C2)-methyltransferase
MDVGVTGPDSARDDVRPGLATVDRDELVRWLDGHGQPAYRGRQVDEAIWTGLASDVAELSTLPIDLRMALAADYRVDTIGSTERRLADGGLTEKALHRLADGALVESVLMHYPARGASRERHTVCISSQVGCAVGCPFCATGELGFGRDLEAAEMCDQVRDAARRLAPSGSRPTNVVFMGMGEPLLNLDRVLVAISSLTDPRRMAMSPRRITVSTSGVVPGIRRLTAERARFNLAVSLHAARDPLRDVLVPINRRWPVAEVAAAAAEHAAVTGRRVSYEVTLIEGINDGPDDAAALAGLLRGQLAHVNLIPMNPVAHTPWQASAMVAVERFARPLRAAGIPVSIRRNRGVEAGAACGQLAAERAGAPPPATVARRRELLVRQSAAALRGDRAGQPVEPAGAAGR